MSSGIVNKTEIELSDGKIEAELEEIAKLDTTVAENNVVTEDRDNNKEKKFTAEIGNTRELKNVEPEKPKIVFVLDKGKIRYRVCEPIILTTYSVNSDTCTQGIYLQKGKYKISFCLSTSSYVGNGLALFSENKVYGKLLTWQTGISYNSLYNQYGKVYFNIEQPAILGITNNARNFMPRDFIGAATVTVFEIKPF